MATTIESLAAQSAPATLKNFINGHWVASSSSERLVVPNPATEAPLAYVPLSNAADVQAAVDAARAAAFEWGEMPPPERAGYLFKLREAMLDNREALAKLVATMRARLPELRTHLQQRLRDRVAEYGASVDPERLAQELALLLQRADVDEEIDRLEGHIAEIRRVIAGDEAAGRRLDFLMQELNREANTLSSKSQELDTTRLAVDMKVLIEQMREQVQNVE